MTKKVRTKYVIRDHNIHSLAINAVHSGLREFEADFRTGAMLAGRDIEDEIHPGAMTRYGRWKAAVGAGDERALATYARLRPGLITELDVTFLADRIDDANPAVELEIIAEIFGKEFAPVVHPVMRDEFMRRLDETECALERLRVRLAANCATAHDFERVPWIANAMVTDEMMEAFCDAMSQRWFLDNRVKECRVVSDRGTHTCHFTDVEIPSGEPHVRCDIDWEDDTRRVALASKSAVWCLLILRDLGNAFYLRPC
ncbi:hypothetical protein [Methylobacterium sp. J-076]|uniref:hypothetical protein n=1 Tax=Methylobacterium sp. J-076 TaxID=2836655 RepID=UPI001FBBA261|nr:hypothetical protein [Methylobacterium sp. J-076]MCJ2015590.1 hypothetical protein [Methylobacterium sp. J-076]